MWTAKLKYWHEGSVTIPYAKKYGVTILAFPMNHYEKDGYFYLTTGHMIIGSDKGREEYFKEIMKNKKLRNIERQGDFIIYTLKAPAEETHMQLYFTPEIMFVKPIAVKPDGYQYLEIASWNKKVLSDFIKRVDSIMNLELSQIKREKVTDFYVPHLMPSLTARQRKAVLLAYANGYYDYPKKTNIEKLAKIMGVSQSTMQEHLRKAEAKLLPFLLDNLTQK